MESLSIGVLFEEGLLQGENGGHRKPGRKDTIMLVVFVSEIVIQHEVLDSSLFFAFRGLLGLH